MDTASKLARFLRSRCNRRIATAGLGTAYCQLAIIVKRFVLLLFLTPCEKKCKMRFDRETPRKALTDCTKSVQKYQDGVLKKS
jgi:hypothetical protein